VGDNARAQNASLAEDRVVGGTQSIQRVAEILRIAAREGTRGVSVTSIGQELSLTRSTAHRVVRALRDVGFLQKAVESDRYRVGRLAWELSLCIDGDLPDAMPWRHAVDHVAARTGHTSYLLTRNGMESVCTYRMEGRGVLRALPIEVGQRRALGIGTGGIALLSGYEESEIRRITQALDVAYEAYPKLAGGCAYELAMDARKRGGAISHGNVLSGVLGVACLVPCTLNAPKFAISIAAPETSVKIGQIDEILDIVRQEIRQAGRLVEDVAQN